MPPSSNPIYRLGESARRITLRIDDALLIAVKEIAQRESKPAGAAVSDLLRQSLVRAEGGIGAAVGLSSRASCKEIIE